jgi:hypothetical protein
VTCRRRAAEHASLCLHSGPDSHAHQLLYIRLFVIDLHRLAACLTCSCLCCAVLLSKPAWFVCTMQSNCGPFERLRLCVASLQASCMTSWTCMMLRRRRHAWQGCSRMSCSHTSHCRVRHEATPALAPAEPGHLL